MIRKIFYKLDGSLILLLQDPLRFSSPFSTRINKSLSLVKDILQKYISDRNPYNYVMLDTLDNYNGAYYKVRINGYWLKFYP